MGYLGQSVIAAGLLALLAVTGADPGLQAAEPGPMTCERAPSEAGAASGQTDSTCPRRLVRVAEKIALP